MVPTTAIVATEDGNLSALQSLDQKKLNENISDEFGCNCMHYAARQGAVNILEFLVQQRGFTGNVRSNVGATAAHDAAAAGNIEALQWLYKNTKCQVDDQDGTGATALHLACRFHHTDVVQWLLDAASADTTRKTASGGLALHFAVVGGDIDAVKLLLEDDPSSVNFQLANGATATYLASQEGHADILQSLIVQHRGNVKMKAYDGMSCLHAAAQSGHLDCVKFLVQEEKCNANERDFDGATPLHYAASQGHTAVIGWLLTEGGAKVTLDNLGGSPLHNAGESNQFECVKTLINHGCSTSITDNNGLTASELARKCFNDKCANLIETFTPGGLPQAQCPVDDDVAYLTSVQSPRPSSQTTSHPVLLNGAGSQSELTNGTHLNGQEWTQGNKSNTAPHSLVNTNGKLGYDPSPWQRPRTTPFNVNGNGSASSSLSSLSQLDEAIAIAEQELEKENRRERAGSLKRRQEVGHSGVGRPSGQRHSYAGGSAENYYKAGAESYSLDFGDDDDDDKSDITLPDGNDSDQGTGHHRDTRTVTFDTLDSVYDANYQDEGFSADMERVEVSKKKSSANSGQPVRKNGGEGQKVRKSTQNGINGEKVMNGHGSDRKSDERKISGEVKQAHRTKSHEEAKEHDGVVMNGSVDAHNAQPNAQKVPKSDHTHSSTQASTKQNSQARSHLSSDEMSSSAVVNGETVPHPNSTRSVNPPLSLNINATEHTNGDTAAVYIVDNEIGIMNTNIDSTKSKTQASASPTMSRGTQANSPVQNDDLATNQHLKKISASSLKRTESFTEDTASQTDLSGPVPAPNSASVPPPAPPPAPSIPPPPPPPGPPPPMPPTAAGNQRSIQNASASFIQEVKLKSTSLPASKTPAPFSLEMIQSQRSTLTPAQARAAIDVAGDNDFISELKKATKGPGLRRTSISKSPGEKPTPTPTMVFSAGQKKTIAKPEPVAKVELTGEWDPKNFMDKVPNKDSLPSWKLMLQARQLAEKTMKETLETRKVEEREARFKNMPAWKRAIVEKKEAEAKVAEEKRQAEAEQKAQRQTSTKKIPTVSVQPKSGEGDNLAPWQLELKKK